jgi:long-subunit fatty acid transport protein
MGMGGAFIGMADDATAAFVNPAGLRAITRIEVSFEGRGRDFSIPVVTGGRVGGTPTQTGIDRIDGLQIEDQSQTAAGLTFASFVYPRARWAVAGYRHELADLDSTIETGGVFTINRFGMLSRGFPTRGSVQLRIATYGVSGSFAVTPALSVGGGLAVYDFSLNARSINYDLRSFFGPATFDRVFFTDLQEGRDRQVGVNVGALWSAGRRFQAGATYRHGPTFDLTFSRDNQIVPEDSGERPGTFSVPHVLGAGVVIRPLTNATIAIDVSRVSYSRLVEGYVTELDPIREPGAYSIPDVTELHAGFEYLFTSPMPLAVRAGYWLDPEHVLEYTGTLPLDAIARREIFSARGDDAHHFTAGGGAVFGNFELNGAVDATSRSTTVSVSGILRF